MNQQPQVCILEIVLVAGEIILSSLGLLSLSGKKESSEGEVGQSEISGEEVAIRITQQQHGKG